MALLGGIGGGKFGSQVGEVSECEFAWVGAITNTEEANIIFDNVAVGSSSVELFCGMEANSSLQNDIVYLL